MTASRRLDRARAHLQAGRLEEAMVEAQKALESSPDNIDAMLLIARIQRRANRYDIAVRMYEMILDHHPESAEGQAGLGACLGALRRYSEAIPPLRQAVELKQDYFEAWSFLGEALIEQGRTREALDCFKRSQGIQPYNPAVLSKYLFHIAFDPRFDEKQIHDLNRGWGQRVEAAVKPLPPEENRTASRKLRIGYLSDEFRQGVSARFMEPVLTQHDRSVFEISCFARNTEQDAMTAQMANHADRWRDLSAMSDREAAETIRDDGIDILVLCTSYRAESRVIMAYRPAPVQVCYANRVSTTGLKSVDYMVSELSADPPGSDDFYTETLIRLSRANVYMPPDEIAAPGPPPCEASRQLTFASFNHLGKLTEEVISVWCQILHAVPESRLVLKSVNRFTDPGTRQWFAQRFSDHGVSGERLSLLSGDPDLASHLDRYRSVDIALDPFPCNGGTTNCEALWMGIPVVTMRGDTFMSRQGATFLGKLGLHDLITETPEDYIAAAKELALNSERRTNLRQTLRGKVEVNLLDPVRHVRELEVAYREMWQRYEAGLAARPFAVSRDTVTAAAE